jgi:hypothetical protein
VQGCRKNVAYAVGWGGVEIKKRVDDQRA